MKVSGEAANFLHSLIVLGIYLSLEPRVLLSEELIDAFKRES